MRYHYRADIYATINLTDPDKVQNILDQNPDFKDEDYIWVENNRLLIGAAYIDYFETDWEKLADQIAPYIEDGAIEFKGEDDSEWGIYFEDKTWEWYKPIRITPTYTGLKNFKTIRNKIKNWEINLNINQRR